VANPNQTKPELWKCAEEQQQQQELNFRHYIEQEGFFFFSRILPN
jgi:hypothetical protein